MADVQLEHGHTRIADALAEAFARAPMPGQHHRVMWAMLRLLYGWRKKTDAIASSQIARATEIDERAVRRILGDLVRWGLLIRTLGGPGERTTWSIQKDFDRWKVEETGAAKRLRTLQDRVRNPGQRTPGEDYTPGEEPRASSARTPGQDHPETPGEEPPLQRQRDNTKEREPAAPEPAAHSSPLGDIGDSQKLDLRLANCLAHQVGKRDEHEAWVAANLELLEAEVGKELSDDATPRQRSAAMRSKAIRYYRQYAKGNRIHRGAAIVTAHKVKRAAQASRDPPLRVVDAQDPDAYESSKTMQSMFDD